MATVRAPGAIGAAPKLAFAFLMLTAARSGEVRLAPGPKSNSTATCEPFPVKRMTANREYRMPRQSGRLLITSS